MQEELVRERRVLTRGWVDGNKPKGCRDAFVTALQYDGAMARLKTHDEALRLRLLHRAAATVFDRGTAALSLRTLAADVKTSTTAVYSLFGNKAGLLRNLYEEAARLFVARLAAIRPTDDPAGDVIRLGLVYREYAIANPHLYAILFSDRSVQCPSESESERPPEAIETYRPSSTPCGADSRQGNSVRSPTRRSSRCRSGERPMAWCPWCCRGTSRPGSRSPTAMSGPWGYW